MFVVLLMMLHPTQELEPPANPERFTVQFAMPHMTSARDAAEAAAAVLKAVAEGNLTSGEGAQVMGLVDSYRRTLEVTELEARVAALEGQKV